MSVQLTLRPPPVVVRPLFRTLQTATPAAEALSLPIEVEHGLGEWLYPVKVLDSTSPYQ